MARTATLLVVLFLVVVPLSGQPRKVVAGLYANPPLVMQDEQGQPAGFFIDILEEVARQENWQLEYRYYGFSEALQALRQGEIDLLPAVAWSGQRDSLYHLNRINVLTNWGQLYKHEDDENSYLSLEDLRHKRVAALRSDYYLEDPEHGLRQLLKELTIPADILVADTYEAALDSLAAGHADLALLSRYYGVLNTAHLPVVKTPVNIAYVSVRYAFAPDSAHRQLAAALDTHLRQFIDNRQSVYYASARMHLTYEPTDWLPPWLWQVLFIVLGGLLVLVLFIVLLQHQVRKKTVQLRLTSRQLGKSERALRLAAQTIEASQDIGFWFQPGGRFIRVNQAALRLTGYSQKELLNMRPADLLASRQNQPLYARLIKPEHPGHIILEDQLRKKDGSLLPVEVSLDRFSLDGETYLCGFARDITRRIQAQRQLEARNRELECLYSIARLGADLDCTTASILEGTIDALLPAWQYPEATCVRIVYGSRKLQSDNYRDTPWQLRVPVRLWGRESGSITVGYTTEKPTAYQGPFLHEEVTLLEASAKLLGSILESKDAERQIIASILATEDKERSRISKELHDSVGQTLSALALHLNNLKKDRMLPEAEKKKLDKIEALLKTVINETRSVSHNLMPPALTDLGFEAAIENLLENLSDNGQTTFSFHSHRGSRKVPREVEFALFRIVQEAVNNSIKHARAREVLIQYLVYDDLISLSIEDDGQGFDLRKLEKKRNFGLNSMKNRAASIGADISIDSSPGRGTHIHVSVPLKPTP